MNSWPERRPYSTVGTEVVLRGVVVVVECKGMPGAGGVMGAGVGMGHSLAVQKYNTRSLELAERLR